MKVKGSIVISRQDLLNMIANAKSHVEYENKKNREDDSKRDHYMLGQLVMLERIMEDDEWKYNWNDFIHEVWDTPWTTGVKPYELFEFLHNPELYPIEETIDLYKLFSMSWLI